MSCLIGMFMQKGANLSSFIADSEFTFNDIFTQDDGLRFAFGIIDYHKTNTTQITDYLEL